MLTKTLVRRSDMGQMFWYFIGYSFLGFGLEVLFARVTGA